MYALAHDSSTVVEAAKHIWVWPCGCGVCDSSRGGYGNDIIELTHQPREHNHCYNQPLTEYSACRPKRHRVNCQQRPAQQILFQRLISIRHQECDKIISLLSKVIRAIGLSVPRMCCKAVRLDVERAWISRSKLTCAQTSTINTIHIFVMTFYSVQKRRMRESLTHVGKKNIFVEIGWATEIQLQPRRHRKSN